MTWFLALLFLMVLVMLSRSPEDGAVEADRFISNLIIFGLGYVIWLIFLKPFLGA